MSGNSIPIERFLFGNEHWRSHRAIAEIEVYCGLLEFLQDRIDSLEIRDRDEEVTLINAQAVNSSYAFEIAMKSLWALDNSDKTVPHTHDLVTLFDGLKGKTAKSLNGLQLTRADLEKWPTPFLSNRYSMEDASRGIAVFDVGLLRQLAQLLEDKLEQTRKELISPP